MVVSSDVWLEEFRENARKEFQIQKFPTAKDEEWRYIDYKFLKQLEQINLEGKSEINFKLETNSKAVIATNINKNFEIAKNYLGKIISLNKDKLISAHYANIGDGLLLFLPKNSSATLKLNISATNSAIHNIIVLEEGAKLNYFENYEQGNGFVVDATEIFAAENSQINFQSFQDFPQDVYHLSYKSAALRRYAVCDWNFGCFGGQFSRWKIETKLEGEGAQSENIAVFFGSGKQHIDITTIAQHIVPHTTNNILAKGVMKDSSSSVFRGLIRIEKPAQKTDSYLADHTLILNKNATANSIPSLQIEANDVRATHGATIGQLDKEQMFYLTSRGLSEKEAEKLIVSGFFEPVLQKILNDEVRNRYQQVIGQRLSE